MSTDEDFTEAALCADELAGSRATFHKIDSKAVSTTAPGTTCSPVRAPETVAPHHVEEDNTSKEHEDITAAADTTAAEDMTTIQWLVPTMFTTANGRAICVRDVKAVRRGSTEWALWASTQTQACAPANTSSSQFNAVPTPDDNAPWSAYLPHFQPPWRQLRQPLCAPSSPSVDTSAGHTGRGWAERKRCRSHSSSSEPPLTDEEAANAALCHAHDAATIPQPGRYSGFIRADGRMIFLQ